MRKILFVILIVFAGSTCFGREKVRGRARKSDRQLQRERESAIRQAKRRRQREENKSKARAKRERKLRQKEIDKANKEAQRKERAKKELKENQTNRRARRKESDTVSDAIEKEAKESLLENQDANNIPTVEEPVEDNDNQYIYKEENNDSSYEEKEEKGNKTKTNSAKKELTIENIIENPDENIGKKAEISFIVVSVRSAERGYLIKGKIVKNDRTVWIYAESMRYASEGNNITLKGTIKNIVSTNGNRYRVSLIECK